MPLSSKPKKVKQKGAVHELKLVQSINRYGSDTYKAEEVKKQANDSQKPALPLVNDSTPSSSSMKRSKFEPVDQEGIEWNLEMPDFSKKRQTLVILFPLCLTIDSQFEGPKRLLETVRRAREIILDPPTELRTPSNRYTLCGMWFLRSSVSMPGLLRSTLVVQALPHKIPCSPSLSSPPTLEGWIIRKCFVMRHGIYFCPWPLNGGFSVPRGR